MENLKVGDKVYIKRNNYGRAIFTVSTVLRTTKTLAILENGIRIKINAELEGKFKQYGSAYNEWQIVTDEIMKKIKNIQSQKTINKWFKDTIFTDVMKRIVYNQFKNI